MPIIGVGDLPRLQNNSLLLKIIETGIPMPIDTQLRQLKTDNLSQVSKRFVDFCKNDIKQYEGDDAFDGDIYQDAIKLIINKLEDVHQPKPRSHT